MDVVRQIVEIFKIFDLPTQVLAASVRSRAHVISVALAGAHCCTLPLKTIESLIHHALTDRGLQTFLEDYRRVFLSLPVGS